MSNNLIKNIYQYLPLDLLSQAEEATASDKAIQEFEQIVDFIYALVAGIAVFIIMIGAIGYITAGGDKGRVASARGRIFNGVLGVIMLIMSRTIISWLLL